MRPALILSVAITLIVASISTSQAQSVRWVNGSNGSMPRGAFEGGNEANGQALYVCRAQHNGGVHIGKFRPDWRGCNIPFGGKELTINRYQVLVVD